jgi:hypothetical protein
VGGGEETIVTNFHEASGKHMLEEPVDELFGSQRTTFIRASLSGAIPEGHAVMFHLHEPVVAQGDPEDVGSQILQRIQPCAHLFTVDNPLLLPDLRRDPGIPSRAT